MTDVNASDQSDADTDEDVDEGPWEITDPIIAAHKYAAAMVEVTPSGVVDNVQAQWFDTAELLDEYFSEVSAELKDDVLYDYADFNVVVLTKIKTEAMDRHLSYRVINKPEQTDLANAIRKRLGSKRVGNLYEVGANLTQSDEEFREAIQVASKDAKSEKIKADKLAEVKPKTASKKKVVNVDDGQDQPEATVKPKVVSKGKRVPKGGNAPAADEAETVKPTNRSNKKRRPQAS